MPPTLLQLTPQESRPMGSVATTLRHMRREGKQAEIRPPCDGCTACCRCGYDVELRPAEAARLPHVPGVKGPILPKAPDGSCIMLQDGRCSIYATRPTTCKTFDCRIFSLAGYLPADLLDTPGFRPFVPTCITRDDRVALLAFRLVIATMGRRGIFLHVAAAQAIHVWQTALPEAE